MPDFPSPTRVATLVCALTFVAGARRHADAQTLGGQVVQLDTKKPLSGAAVALVNDSAQIVASTSASPEGAFYLDAPRPGEYRLVLFVAGASFVSPSVKLDSGKTIEKQFSVPDVPDAFASTLFARDVTSEATPLPGSPQPAYPSGLLEEGIRGLVSAMFVVNETGHPELATLRVLSATNERFAESVRGALQRTRFVPAQKDGAPVRQVVQHTYDFGLAGDPARGDVLIRPAAPRPVAATKSPRGKYVLSEAELSQPEIHSLSILDAMRRLRPQIFTESAKNPQTLRGALPESGIVYVDDVLSDGDAALRELRAGQAVEVRYWTREEAAMKFGMDYTYGVTVKLRHP
jgi:TonB family protein